MSRRTVIGAGIAIAGAIAALALIRSSDIRDAPEPVEDGQAVPVPA